MKITKGLKFRSKWFDGIVEVVSIFESSNEMDVLITRSPESAWHETWNIQHTKWGFEREEYFMDTDKGYLSFGSFFSLYD